MNHSPSIDWGHTNRNQVELIGGECSFCQPELEPSDFLVDSWNRIWARVGQEGSALVSPMYCSARNIINDLIASRAKDTPRSITKFTMERGNLYAFYFSQVTADVMDSPFFVRVGTHAIVDLPDSRCLLLKPIPVHLEQDEDGEWVASFKEANISMSGSSANDAQEALAEDIVAAFVLYLEEEDNLGPGPQRQLAALRKYISILP